MYTLLKLILHNYSVFPQFLTVPIHLLLFPLDKSRNFRKRNKLHSIFDETVTSFVL